MSVERELLIAAVEWLQELKYMWADTRYSGDWVLLELIADINKIEQLLAQPEPFKPDWANYRQGVADSKREPLSNIDIKEASRNAKDMSFYNGVKWAERQHGIGGDDETV